MARQVITELRENTQSLYSYITNLQVYKSCGNVIHKQCKFMMEQ